MTGSLAMEVAGVGVPSGAVRRHSLPIVELPDGTGVSLPLLLINGASPGPRLYLGAAIHGDEVAGVEILSTALAGVSPSELSGSVVCVPVQNPLALHADHRIPVAHYLRSPLDQAPIDAWSIFPGQPDGNFAQRLAHRLFELITRCDFAIDCHTPTRGGRYPPIAILPPASLGEAARRAEDLAVGFGSGYIMKTDAGMYVSAGILGVEATRAGTPAFTFEIGEGGRAEPQVISEGVRCVLNAFRHLKMLPGPLVPPAQSVRLRAFAGIRATRGGLLRTGVDLGARVERGDVLARIVSVYGDEVEAIRAPASGVFIRATTLTTVSSGERVATVGILE
ncbi:MAG TPA: succinylglutamate desuccinylase/aspartoacylase family protein [Candidatus Methylomirabilis sp.]|nr:succinylglutamate desuccinylase/aspartoacylase family protein [Candidatus Methylomirabilis sp.]